MNTTTDLISHVNALVAAETAALRAENAALREVLEKVELFGNVSALSIGAEAALMELSRNARAALLRARGEK